ncbi:MAG: thioredoxin [Candidatus Dojkabacteria bacterium]|nr:MAG: thioredoxin [Candidatus Dojkabacteria bacterium]
MIQQTQAYTTLTDSNFESETNEGYVVVDFWAEWCGPCLAFAPVFEKVAEEMGEKVKFAKLNVDDNPSIAQKFGVMSIPTIILLKDGKEVSRQMGAMPEVMFRNWLENQLESDK